MIRFLKLFAYAWRMACAEASRPEVSRQREGKLTEVWL